MDNLQRAIQSDYGCLTLGLELEPRMKKGCNGYEYRGCVREYKPGKWLARIRIHGHQYAKTLRSEAEAREWIERVKKEHIR